MTHCFLVLTGDGINCANETAWAFELAGGSAEIIHINDLLVRTEKLLEYDGLAIPGGFSRKRRPPPAQQRDGQR